MILISHRGNIDGRKPQLENGQRYCQTAIDAGYNVEIDVWVYDDIFWTGHARPQYRVDEDFFLKEEEGTILEPKITPNSMILFHFVLTPFFESFEAKFHVCLFSIKWD